MHAQKTTRDKEAPLDTFSTDVYCKRILFTQMPYGQQGIRAEEI
jgi:hypothetical protein